MRLSRCFCSKGRMALSGRWISGKESGISCDLHKLKCCSKTIARDASKSSSKVHGSEGDDCNREGKGQTALYSAQQDCGTVLTASAEVKAENDPTAAQIAVSVSGPKNLMLSFFM